MPKRRPPDPTTKRPSNKTKADLVREVATLRRRIARLQKRSSSNRRDPASLIQPDTYLASVIESAMDAIITLDEDQRVVLFNAAAERMFDCPASEALGTSVDRFIPERFRVEHRRHLRRFGESGATSRHMGRVGQVIGLRADGSEFPLEAAISRVEINGRTFFTVIHRDITDRIQAEQALAKERAFVSTVLETAGALVVLLDREGRILRFNRACEKLTGYTFDEVKGQRVWDLFIVPEEVESVQAVFHALVSGQYPNEHENFWLTKDGGRRYIAWSNTVLVNESGIVDSVVGIGLDLTERQKAKIRQAGELTVLTMIDAGAPLADILKRICLLVEEQSAGSACSILEYDHGVLRARAAPSLPSPVMHAIDPVVSGSALWHRVVSRKERVVMAGLESDLLGEAIQAMMKRERLAACWILPIHTSASETILGVLWVSHREARGPNAEETALLDLACHLAGIAFEHHWHQEALRQSHKELKALTARLLTAQDDERRRISRELHDDLNQRLAVLALNMQTAQRGMTESDRAFPVLQECYDAVAAISEDIRRLAYHLHPSILDDLGLEAALRAFVHECAKREGVTVTFTAERIPTTLPKEAASCLYRIGQESLQNVAKHAHATSVAVELVGSEEGVTLTIADNGVGFSQERMRAAGRGLGLISMQERIRLVDGRLTIHTQPGTGTVVSAWVPIRPMIS